MCFGKHKTYTLRGSIRKTCKIILSDPLREVDVLPTYKGYIIDLVTRLNVIRTLVYDNLVESKEKSKKYYDRAMNPRNFHIGDYVFLLKGPKPKKFGDHYSGPHKVLEIINKNNVKIQYKNGSKVVHANRLRISHINQIIKPKRKKQKDSVSE